MPDEQPYYESLARVHKVVELLGRMEIAPRQGNGPIKALFDACGGDQDAFASLLLTMAIQPVLRSELGPDTAAAAIGLGTTPGGVTLMYGLAVVGAMLARAADRLGEDFLRDGASPNGEGSLGPPPEIWRS